MLTENQKAEVRQWMEDNYNEEKYIDAFDFSIDCAYDLGLSTHKEDEDNTIPPCIINMAKEYYKE